MGFRDLQRGVLGGLAGGSLAVGLPWQGVLRAARGSVESDASGLALAVVANVLVESRAVSEALTWLLVLGVLYAYTDVVYLNRMDAFTDRLGFRLLTAVVSGGFALSVRYVSGGWGIAVSLLAMFASLAVFSVYLWRIDVDVFDSEGPVLELLARMSSATPEELLGELEDATGTYRHVVAWSFYGAPAMIFTVSCLLLGVVMLALVRMYPLPELTVLAVFALGVVDSVAPVEVSDRFRSGLHIEERIVSPLAAATATMRGIALTILCAAQLLFSGLVFVIATGLVLRLGSYDVWATLPGYLESAGTVAAVVLVGRLVAAVTLPLAVFAWGIYGILFWVRELQRLPAMVAGRSAVGADDATPAVARIPGAMLPANALVFVTVGSFSRLLQPRFEAGGDLGSTAHLWPITLHLLATLVLFSGCAWTVRRAWRMSPQSVDDEAVVLAVAFLGTQWTLLAMNALLAVIAPLEAASLGTVFLVAVVVLLGYVRFSLDITESASVGPVSGDGLFAAVTASLAVAGGGFLHWYYPGASPWLPGIFLAFAAAVVGLYLLSRE